MLLAVVVASVAVVSAVVVVVLLPEEGRDTLVWRVSAFCCCDAGFHSHALSSLCLSLSEHRSHT